MKRLHVSLSVKDLEQSIAFYATLFDAEPTVRKQDYAKWMLEDPRVNFSITARACGEVGVNHLGIQTDQSQELAEITERLHAAGEAALQQKAANCCYAVSDKTWVEDPSGVQWETFHTHGEITTFGADSAPIDFTEAKADATAAEGKCCG